MVEFTIPGPPVAKQRPRRAADGHWYTPKKTVDAENHVAQCAMAAGLKLEPKKHYSLEIDLYLSSFRKDRDNQLKLIQDGLMRMGADWDDSQVHNLVIRTISVKDAGEEKAVVRVEVIHEDE